MADVTFYQLMLKALVEQDLLTTSECSEILKQLVKGVET